MKRFSTWCFVVAFCFLVCVIVGLAVYVDEKQEPFIIFMLVFQFIGTIGVGISVWLMASIIDKNENN